MVRYLRWRRHAPCLPGSPRSLPCSPRPVMADLLFSDRARLLCRRRRYLFFFQAEDGIRDLTVTGVQTCALPILNQPWASDGATALYAILNWSRTPEGVTWLLAHGADPNAVFAENGETSLHVVARAWDVPLAEAMVGRGADIERKRADGRTPYAVAELNGNRAVADWLLAQGASPELSAVDRLVAACSRGDRKAAEALLATNPGMRNEITDDHYIAFHQAAERNDVGALEAMLACGFDPNRPDAGIGKTALHSAAMEGWPDAVRVLLAHGASEHVRDREFKGHPLIWAAEGSRQGRDGRDFAAVGKLLLEAGSPVEWETTDEPAEGILEIVAAWRRGGRSVRGPVGGYGFSNRGLPKVGPAKTADGACSAPPVLRPEPTPPSH